jgi:hypothetical protein
MRPISDGKIERSLIMQRKDGKNYHGFIRVCVAPSVVHWDEKRFA